MESSTPFATISVGDLLNPQNWSAQGQTNLEPVTRKFGARLLLSVTGVEHLIVEANGVVTQHKLGIFTEAVSDNDDSRP